MKKLKWTNKAEGKQGNLKLVAAVVSGYILAASILNACGSGESNQRASSVSGTPGAASSALTAGALPFRLECASVSTDVSAIPNETQNALIGTYFGTFTKLRGEEASQPYTLIVSKAQTGNRSYFYGTLRSSGPAGNIEESLCLTMGNVVGLPYLLSDNSFGSKFDLVTPSPVSIPVLSENFSLSVELRLMLRAGNKIDPTQSEIYIKDCVFSEECSALEVELADFGKR